MGKTTVTRRAFAQLADGNSGTAGERGSRRYARAAAAAERSNAVCGCTSKMAKWFEPKVTKPASTLWAIIAARGKRPFRLHIILIVSSSQ